MQQLLVLTGLSGAGRSTAAGTLDDLGLFVIDNLPPALVPKVVELAGSSSPTSGQYDRIALAVSDIDEEMQAEIAELRRSVKDFRLVFLDCSVDTLVRRYESTKRRHPLSDGSSLVGAIEREVEHLAPVKAMADLVIDTTALNPHQLRERLTDEFAGAEPPSLQLSVSSYGFKHGVPLDVDTAIDCRFLPNPYWEESLRDLSGLDPEIREFVLERPETERFLARLLDLLDELLPAYAADGRSYLRIGFGCTGGRHRSVAVAEYVAAALKDRGWMPRVNHRDIER